MATWEGCVSKVAEHMLLAVVSKIVDGAKNKMLIYAEDTFIIGKSSK